MTTTQPSTAAMKKSWSRGSESSTHLESPRFYSPMRWDGNEPPKSPEYRSPEYSPAKPVDNSMAVVAVDKLKKFSPEKITQQQKPPELAATVYNRSAREEPQRPAAKAGTTGGIVDRRSRPAPASSTAEEVMRKAALGFRLCEVAVCLISFSVMAADKTQGWSGDSYDRYKEYRAELNIRPWETTLHNIQEGNKRITWKDRIPYAFWKGNPAVSNIRKELVKCNISEEQDWNARIYGVHWSEAKSNNFEDTKLENQCTYRYKIYAEGATWSVLFSYEYNWICVLGTTSM